MRAGALNVALAGPEGAPALVLLHGLGASWHAWSAAMEHLAHRLRVVAVDLPGFGRSPELPGGRFALDEVGAALAAALDELGVGDHALAGHSMGGGVAIAYATERPQRVRRLALVAPAGLIATGAVRASWRSPRRHRVGREVTRLAEPLVAHSARLKRVAFKRLVHDPDELTSEQVHDLVRGSRSGRSTGQAGIAIVHAGLRDRLGAVTMPTLVIWGEGDEVVSPAYGAELAAALPDGRLLMLPETGHLPMIERPAEVASAIAAHALT